MQRAQAVTVHCKGVSYELRAFRAESPRALAVGVRQGKRSADRRRKKKEEEQKYSGFMKKLPWGTRNVKPVEFV